MYSHLIEEAKEVGITSNHVAALIVNREGKILLIKEDLSEKPTFSLPTADIKEEETIQQALQRAVLEETFMELAEVKRYLGHYDIERDRYYHFITGVKDPYSLESNAKIAYAWLDAQEAVGYPIIDQLRDMLDIYAKSQMN